MKKILIPLLILLFTLPALSQTGTGWAQYRTKANFRDSTYHYRDANFYGTLRVREGYVRIGAVTVTANGQELNILDGALVSTTELNRLVGVTSNVQTQLNSKADLSNPQFSLYPRRGSDTIATRVESRLYSSRIIRDTMLARLNAAQDIRQIAWTKPDTIIYLATKKDIQNLAGSGGMSTKYKLQFTVGDAGYPDIGDSVITHTAWAGREVEVFKGGDALYYNTGDVNLKPGFRKNNTTGQITVRPVFSSEEQIIINAYDPTNVVWLSVAAAQSTLITGGIKAYYKLNETTGTVVNDEVASYDGTTNATVGIIGKDGYAEQFNGISQFINLGNTVGDMDTCDFTITAWINPSAYPGAWCVSGVFGTWGDYPYFYMGIDQGTGNKATGVINFSGTNIEVFSNETIPLDTLTHLAMLCDRDGNMTLYVNGALQTDTQNISAGVAINMDNNNMHTIGQIGTTYSGYNFTGIIDEVGIYPRLLTESEITEAMNETYPF